MCFWPFGRLFLSTLSLRRATSASYNEYLAEGISIHALLAESDQHRRRSRRQVHLFLSTLSLRRATLLQCSLSVQGRNFYPRSPCGERRLCDYCERTGIAFLSTLSLRRATCYSLRYSASRWHFYPRSPCGERPTDGLFIYVPKHFYPRSPCGERRQAKGLTAPANVISIHALLAESDQLYIDRTAETIVFLSTLSLRRATIKL